MSTEGAPKGSGEVVGAQRAGGPGADAQSALHVGADARGGGTQNPLGVKPVHEEGFKVAVGGSGGGSPAGGLVAADASMAEAAQSVAAGTFGSLAGGTLGALVSGASGGVTGAASSTGLGNVAGEITGAGVIDGSLWELAGALSGAFGGVSVVSWAASQAAAWVFVKQFHDVELLEKGHPFGICSGVKAKGDHGMTPTGSVTGAIPTEVAPP